jgi:hypothetical protein
MFDAAVPLKNAPFLILSEEQLRAIIDRYQIRVGVDEVHAATRASGSTRAYRPATSSAA